MLFHEAVIPPGAVGVGYDAGHLHTTWFLDLRQSACFDEKLLLLQADRDTAAWEAEQGRVRTAELEAQLATAQAEADAQRSAKDDAQSALTRARSRSEELSDQVQHY